MDLNKKRIFIVVIISALLFGLFMLFVFTDITYVLKGETYKALVKEGEMEFDLEKVASIRNKPSFSSKVIGTIEKGKHVQVLIELNEWVKITDGTNTGWVIKQSVVTIEGKIENNTTTEPDNTVPENKVENNVTITPENKVENNVTTKPDNKVENNVETNSNNTSNVGKKGVVNVDTAKVRNAPDGKMIGLVDLDDKVEILGEEGDWYKVNIDEYKNCYIAKRLVTIK